MWSQIANADPFLLTRGVLSRRIFAYLLDLFFIALVGAALCVAAFIVTILSLGLLHLVWAVIPFTAVIYGTLTIGGPHAATWGMRITSISYRRLEGGMPDYAQALVATILFYVTVGLTGGLVLLIPLFSNGSRTLHDILSGLILVRTDIPAEF